ncbi:MAG: Porphobilinogen deaminase [uncultured Phycisphaerae bacterium]|uniref:Porphobilinogen deaminase n=1 Tax=uncultured Phycisphaerae bacterium TaxID=904963 RepID=A0A6J4Q0Q0_9BACT|nr:MAG: Porphobilinogen deaminase [uncultured Phycisphaerae bacterium]
MPDSPPAHTLRLGTRGSLLAKAQSTWVARQIEARVPGVRVELVVITTSGDRITDQPLHAFGGKGLFTKELEQALLAGTVDFAVHSFKDVPVTMPLVDTTDLLIAAVPAREDPRDALAAATGLRSIDALPAGARIGTGSLRRRSQILARRPDLVVEPIRGNIDTRLRKLREGQFDAVVLATAGLKRGGLMDDGWMTPIEPDVMLPAAGQGALALECRRDDAACRRVLASMHDPMTAVCVEAEREVVRGLGGDCHSPIAALATVDGNRVTLRVVVGARDGHPPVIGAEAAAPMNGASAAVVKVLADLERQGVRELLHGSMSSGDSMAAPQV